MKSIKKIFKVIFCFAAFAVTSIAFAINPSVKTYAAKFTAEHRYQMAISSLKMPKVVDASKEEGAEFKIPLLSVKGNFEADYTIRVIDPAGQKHDYKVNASDNDTDYFDASESGYVKVKPLNDGYYDVVYIMSNGSENFFSEPYRVSVKNVAYELDFASQQEGHEGEKTLLPKKVVVSSTEKIALPTAYYKNSSTGVVGTTPVSMKVMKDGVTELEANATGSELTLESDVYYLSRANSGTYTVEYSYNYGSNPPKKTYTIEVVGENESFSAPTYDNTTISSVSLPSMQLGAKGIKLPSLTVSDSTGTNVDHNVTITISKINDKSVSKTLKPNTYTFDMTKEFFGKDYASMVGDYQVTYHVTTAYLTEGKDFSYVVKGVTDSSDPKVFMAYDYTVENNEVQGTVDTDYAADLKKEYGYSEIVLPAIYAEDTVTEYKDLILYRYIRKTNGGKVYYIDNKKLVDGELKAVNENEDGYNYSADTNIGDVTKAVSFKFFTPKGDDSDTVEAEKIAGDYELVYQAIGKTVKTQTGNLYESRSTRYKFTVSKTGTVVDNTNEAPEISIKGLDIENIDPTVKQNIKLNVTDDSDTRVKSAVFKFYGSDVSNISNILGNAINAHSSNSVNVLYSQELLDSMTSYTKFTRLEKDEDNSSEFVVDLSDYDTADGTKVTILAVGIDDLGQFSIDTRVLNVKDVNDNVAPEVVEVSDDYATLGTATYYQGATVVLPNVTFTDNSSVELSRNVSYYIDPELQDIMLDYKTPKGVAYTDTAVEGEMMTKGGSILARKPGKYYVVYTATDDAGNSTSAYFTFTVTAQSKPILNVDVTGDVEKNDGVLTAKKTGAVVNFKPQITNDDGSINTTITDLDCTVDNGEGLSYEPSGYGKYSYVFNDAGTYLVKFTANGGDLQKEFTVTVSTPKLEWTTTPNVQEYAKKGDDVYLPLATAMKGDKKAEVKVEVKLPNGTVLDDLKLVLVSEGGRQMYKFTTEEGTSGTYKVTYTATVGEETLPKTYSIKVGDNVKPTITMNYEKELSQDIVYDGNDIEYKINLELYNTATTDRKLEIVVTSNNKQIYSYNTGLKITDKNDSSSSINTLDWSKLKVELLGDSAVLKAGEATGSNKLYTISGKGQFTLKLTVTDYNDNETVKEIKFNVIEESEVEEKKDSVAGVVLIVTSLLVLAGVILFFVLTGNKKGGNTRSKKSKKDDVVTTKSEKSESETTESEVETEAKESNDEPKAE